MEWFLVLNKAIKYLEDNLENKISLDDVANEVYYSSSHFQRMFNLTTGITIGEYLRNRRLSLAGKELSQNNKVTDIAIKYQYDTVESFSKAFYRFHGLKPSEIKKHPEKLRFFNPLIININIQGGFEMASRLVDNFYWSDFQNKVDNEVSDKDKYQVIVRWAAEARGQNPIVFDNLTEWMLDDSEWDTEEKLLQNEQIFINGVISRFHKQNRELKVYLKELETSGLVNKVIFDTLNFFDDALEGRLHNDDPSLELLVNKMFNNFSLMKDPSVRKQIAGDKTGPTGTDTVETFGYINYLKEADASVQWALFMPETVKQQQKGFKVESFTYENMPNMRFIGFEGSEYEDVNLRLDKMKVIREIAEENKTDFNYDILFMHHNGQNVDKGEWHGVWGRFVKENTPVPEGFIYYDFLTYENEVLGAPYISQFAYARFTGDIRAMHSREGYDCDAMYDVTRNIILAQNVCIPYPKKYWTAEVFINGCNKDSTAFLFSIKK